MIFNEFTWWSVLYVLITTHITILTVTIYLHRCVSHRSLSVSKPVEHFFRFWSWMTTGQNAREWASVHRKHHAYCEKEGDPHSPKVYGLWNILFKGVSYYRKEAKNPETLEKYGKLTPNDWIENNLYRKHSMLGLVALALIDLFIFGWHGVWIYLIQIAWIPFWAAGVVNGVGHAKGYRNFNTEDDSTNLSPIGLIIGGEELHNNHHAYPTSAKLSMKWYEFDIGWGWIKVLEFFKLAKVNKIHRLPKYDKNKNIICENSLDVFLANRHFIWKLFKKQTTSDVKNQLKLIQSKDAELSNYSIRKLKDMFYELSTNLSAKEKLIVEKILQNDTLKKLYEFKETLWNIWNNRQSSYQQLKDNLTHWCKNAKQSQLKSLEEISKRIVWLKPA